MNEASGKPYEISASVGYVTAVPCSKDQLFELIQQADSKMYAIKKSKRNNRT